MALMLDAANFDVAIKALTLLLLIGAAAALWEILRYVRALRHERELHSRLTARRIQDELPPNDPRVAAVAYRGGPGRFGRFVRKSMQAVGVLTVLIVATAAAAMPFLGTWLERQDYLEKADYIVPLPGDSQRLLKAADLYKQGFAPRVVLSRAPAAATEQLQKLRLDAGYPKVDPDELQLRTLEKAGVPRASTAMVDSNEESITGAAEALKRHAEGRKVRVIVVASGIHALRAKLTFEDALPRSRIIVVSTPEGGEPWWSTRDSTMRTLGEAVRVAHHWMGSGLRGLQAEPDVRWPAPAGTAAKPPESLGSGRETRRP